MRASGWDFLDHMIDDCNDILVAIKETPDMPSFIENRIINKSVTYSLLNLGELMKTFSEKDKDVCPNIPWKRIIGFRDRAAHGYHSLNIDIIWDISQNHIKPLLDILNQQKAKMESNN